MAAISTYPRYQIISIQVNSEIYTLLTNSTKPGVVYVLTPDGQIHESASDDLARGFVALHAARRQARRLPLPPLVFG
jgi:hypothetical protein